LTQGSYRRDIYQQSGRIPQLLRQSVDQRIGPAGFSVQVIVFRPLYP
jgi:hypothetical protein